MSRSQRIASRSVITIPYWLEDDMERAEALLTATAGAPAHPLVSEACLHLAKAGGKRLRPALVLLASRRATGTAHYRHVGSSHRVASPCIALSR